MKIGILSDSHGHVRRMEAALQAMAALGPEALVHCGDIGSAGCVKRLTGSGLPVYAVLGNVDRHSHEVVKAAEQVGLVLGRLTVELPLGDGEHLVATHGHNEQVLAELIVGGRFPYVCHGHTHRRRDERVGKVRIINPGAIHAPRDNLPGACMLDTLTDHLEFVDLPTRK